MKTALPSPAVVFWELTRLCGLRCLHCRSRADKEKSALSAAEALRVADSIAEAGVRLVVLTGGEPTLSPAWEKIAERLASAGVMVRLFISGYGFDERTLQRALEAGVRAFAVSFDGPKFIHDRLRPAPTKKSPSAFDEAVRSMKMILTSGATLRAVTQVNALNADRLEETYEILCDLGVKRWQVQLCQMAGEAAQRRKTLMIEPEKLEGIMKVLMRAAREKRLTAPLHCTLGYMTLEEPVLRNREREGRTAVWDGCDAGMRTMAILPDGGVKGCVSLPDEFVTANLRERSLKEIWAEDSAFRYTRNWTAENLAGECAPCAFGAVCKAGCPAVAYGMTGSIGANPYCLKLVRNAR